MKTEVFVTYTVCKVRDKSKTIPLTVEQYENVIGMLAFFGEVYDIQVDVNTVTDDNDPELVNAYITHKVVVY